MTRGLKALLTALVCSSFWAAPAAADTINIRQVDTGNFGQLGGMFSNIGSAINPLTDQVGTSLFTTIPGVVGPTLFFENPSAALRDTNVFGIYSAANPSLQLVLFGGPASPMTSTGVEFLGDGSVQLAGNPLSNLAGFGSTFGFFLSNEYGHNFTQDSLNGGGNPQAFISRGHGDQVNLGQAYDGAAGCQGGPGTCASDLGRWYVAFEDLPFALTDRNFSDIVVSFEGVQAVPEPGTLVLLGLGLFTVASMARRRSTAPKQ